MTDSNRVAKCGTRSGYNKHLKLKEPTCEPCKEASRKWVADWSARHPERIKEINKKARAKYRSRPEIAELRRQKGREYLRTESGREASTRSNHSRRARKLNNKTSYYTVKQVLDLYGATCHICNQPIDLTLPRKVGQPNWEMALHLDHVVPLARGGSDTIDNVRPSHGICNKKKGHF
jgi:5-methylcytosine-specific restriction endonuclease McrA